MFCALLENTELNIQREKIFKRIVLTMGSKINLSFIKANKYFCSERCVSPINYVREIIYFLHLTAYIYLHKINVTMNAGIQLLVYKIKV